MKLAISAVAAVILLLIIGLYYTPSALAPGSMQESEEEFTAQRISMVEKQLKSRDITDSLVLAAMTKVRRHLFVPDQMKPYAYADYALPIEQGQTISQPYVVAMMTQLAKLQPGDAVLEIGTGSGYQAAVLAEITDKVYTIEIDCVLAEAARKLLDTLGYTKVVSKCGDGYEGWPEYAPFDAIIVTAAAPRIPEPLKDQLKVGGTMVIPVGASENNQILKTITRTKDGFLEKNIDWVAFVPMTGKIREQQQ